MLLNIPSYPTTAFTHTPGSHTLSAEASTLGLRPGHVWHQLYDDACDVGIALRSDRTGHVTTWYLCEGDTVTDAEGDVLYWVLKPTSETLRRGPQLSLYRLIIFND